MNAQIIKDVCDIVDSNEDAEKAYDDAMDYINDLDLDVVSIELVRTIEKHLDKGSHPAEGMADIYNDKTVKNLLK